MPFDAHKNLAVATIVTAPSPATTGTSLVVVAGQGARFGAVPFNATVWPADMPPDPTTAEAVRVTARTTDTLTILRAQEGTTARAIVAGDFIAATITAKSLTDIEAGTNFPIVAAAGDVTTGGNLYFSTVGEQHIRHTTLAAADAGSIYVAAAGAVTSSRGAYIGVGGNQASFNPGVVTLLAGNVPTGTVDFLTGASSLRGRWDASGRLLVTVPSAGVIGTTAGLALLGVTGETISSAGTATGAYSHWMFLNGNGFVGSIVTSGSATAYNTTSDARLKTPLNRHTDTAVLRNTVIHNFVWKSDGTAGRGVFAQEAHEVAPFAVSVGGDEVDGHGLLMKPWGVDYSKYVPDLIVGWQHHAATLSALEDHVTRLRTELDGLAASAAIPAARPSWVGQIYQRVCVWLSAWWTPQEITP